MRSLAPSPTCAELGPNELDIVFHSPRRRLVWRGCWDFHRGAVMQDTGLDAVTGLLIAYLVIVVVAIALIFWNSD